MLEIHSPRSTNEHQHSIQQSQNSHDDSPVCTECLIILINIFFSLEFQIKKNPQTIVYRKVGNQHLCMYLLDGSSIHASSISLGIIDHYASKNVILLVLYLRKRLMTSQGRNHRFRSFHSLFCFIHLPACLVILYLVEWT